MQQSPDTDAAAAPSVPSLFDLCVESLARNLHLFDALEHLPEFIAVPLLGRFATFFKRRLGKLNDGSLQGYVELLRTAVQGESESSAPGADGKGKVRVFDTLNLPWCARITDDGVCALISSWSSSSLSSSSSSSLTNLNLGFCSSVSCDGVVAFAQACPHLRSVDLTFTKCGDRGIKALASRCPDLERLSLEQCARVTDTGIQALARGFKRGRLSHLNLGGLDKVSNVGIQILASHLRGLRMLSLSGCNILDFDVEDVCKSLLLLEDLRLRCCWRLTDASVRQIARLAKKQTGAVGGKRENRQQFLAGSASGGAERGGYGIALRRLDLGGCKRITSRGVACIAKTCVQLEHLDLRGVEQVDDAAMTACSRLAALQSLNITGCKGVSEEGFAFFEDQKCVRACVVVGWRLAAGAAAKDSVVGMGRESKK